MIFSSPLQKFQFYDKYSRFSYDLGRRETWEETVDRAVRYLIKLSRGILPPNIYESIYEGIYNMQVMPSMRLLAMAGPAADRQNACLYNCAYVAVDNIYAFVEALIISMSGGGVGYSVESQFVNQLPTIEKQRGTVHHFTVEDSSEGWAEALHFGLRSWFSGEDVRFDLSDIRPGGTPLKIKGGQASGPEPLRFLLDYIRDKILSKQGLRLSPLEAHDIMCAVGGAAVSGGVRRTALISLFDLYDEEMLHCKDGDFYVDNPQRWNANNSAVWNRHLSQAEVRRFMQVMSDSERGEPGIFSRIAALNTKPIRRDPALFGSNPCGEILLRSQQFCNLSSAVARFDDTPSSLGRKVELATIIGTIQATATHFPGLRGGWSRNCAEERLLGVDLTGQLDSQFAQDPVVQKGLLDVAARTNVEYAKVLGISPARAITCVKPSGNSSVLLNCSSGLHPRWSKYYIRRVRVAAHSPIAQVLIASDVPMNPENGQTWENANTYVVSFPVESPDGAIVRGDRSALEQCEYWASVKQNWTEHNPSVTITYHPHELHDLSEWIYRHQDIIGGMSFLPDSGALYDQMPYEAISREEYQYLIDKMPDIDFGVLPQYEAFDTTTVAQEIACVGGLCEL